MLSKRAKIKALFLDELCCSQLKEEGFLVMAKRASRRLHDYFTGLFSANMAMRSSISWYWSSRMNEVQTRSPS